MKLPFPRPVIMNGERLPASYANFYIANGAVLVPTFNDPNDRIALNTIAELMPGRAGDRHPRRRPGVGPGHAALPHAAGTAATSQASPKGPGLDVNAVCIPLYRVSTGLLRQRTVTALPGIGTSAISW